MFKMYAYLLKQHDQHQLDMCLTMQTTVDQLTKIKVNKILKWKQFIN